MKSSTWSVCFILPSMETRKHLVKNDVVGETLPTRSLVLLARVLARIALAWLVQKQLNDLCLIAVV